MSLGKIAVRGLRGLPSALVSGERAVLVTVGSSAVGSGGMLRVAGLLVVALGLGLMLHRVPAGAGTASASRAAGPSLFSPAVQPSRGPNSVPFTFRVTYSHPGGLQPTSLRLQLLDPAGALVPLVDPEMQPPPPSQRSPEALVSPGWVYTSQPILLSVTGTYRYSFIASDGTVGAEAPAPPAVGPISEPVDPAALMDPLVASVPGSTTQVTYRVTYQQSQNITPTIWVVVDGQSHEMVKQTLSDTITADGMVFTHTRARPSGTPPFTYHFVAHAPGIDVRMPQTGSLFGPNTPPVLAAGSVSPLLGHSGTLFTFSVRCRDADGTGDPVVSVLVANSRLEMSKSSAPLSADGAEYTLQTKLPAGQLMHSFTATDGQDSVRLLDTTGKPFAGPNVLAETGLNTSVLPLELALDGASAIVVNGILDPVVPSADIAITYEPPVGSPEPPRRVLTGADGRFSDRFVPNRSGTWNVRVSYAGEAGAVGGGQQGPFPVVVAPASFLLPAGLSMLGLPVLPDSADLGAILGTGVRLARWNGTAYVVGPGGAFPAVQPGVGVWVRADTARQVAAVGTAVRHNQAAAVPVRKGWNQVANPFLAPISWADVSFQPVNGTPVTLAQAAEGGGSRLASEHGWIYEAGQYALVHASVPGAVRDLGPWRALWFKANVDGTLIFAPPATRSADPAVRRAAGGRDGVAVRDDWAVGLVASNGVQSDSYNFAGVIPDSRGVTYAALESPPVLNGYVDLYFTGANGGSRLATDYRSPGNGSMAWDLMVETDITDRSITLEAPNLASVPKEMEVLLEDVDAGGKRTYLRTAGGYSFNPGQQGQRHLRLIVQRRSDAALRISDIEIVPARGGRAITCSVNRDALLTVEVRSPAGKRLKLVSDRQAAPQGRATVIWDGTRDDGARLPSGVYLVQVTAVTPEGQASRTTKPMVVVRW